MQATIAGLIEDVEQARIKLRQFTPVSLTIPLLEARDIVRPSQIEHWLQQSRERGVLKKFHGAVAAEHIPPGRTLVYEAPCLRLYARARDEELLVQACSAIEFVSFERTV